MCSFTRDILLEIPQNYKLKITAMKNEDEKYRKIIAMFGGIKAYKHFFRNDKDMVIEVKKGFALDLEDNNFKDFDNSVSNTDIEKSTEQSLSTVKRSKTKWRNSK